MEECTHDIPDIVAIKIGFVVYENSAIPSGVYKAIMGSFSSRQSKWSIQTGNLKFHDAQNYHCNDGQYHRTQQTEDKPANQKCYYRS